MLAAHLVPGYFAAVESQLSWKPEWSKQQRFLLWAVALGSTILPDLDVFYNVLFRGFFNHSILWTHSVFVYLGFGLLWGLLYGLKRYSYLRTIVGLIAIGGFSHLVLDVVAHGTPLFYPVSMYFVSIAPGRVVEGGVLAYLTDPIFLLEPALFAAAVVHWVCHQRIRLERRRQIVILIVGGLLGYGVVFLVVLPWLQQTVSAIDF